MVTSTETPCANCGHGEYWHRQEFRQGHKVLAACRDGCACLTYVERLKWCARHQAEFTLVCFPCAISHA